MINEDIIIDELKMGSEEAFALIFKEYQEALLNHLFRMLGNHALAEDLLQDVLITMIQKINFYKNRDDLKDSFKSWLFRIATNKAIDEIRKKKGFIDIHENEIASEQCLESDLSNVQMNEFLNEKIMQLPLVQRTFLGLRVYEEMPIKDIAKVCDCQVNTVKQGLFRARKTLKDLLIGEGVTL